MSLVTKAVNLSPGRLWNGRFAGPLHFARERFPITHFAVGNRIPRPSVAEIALNIKAKIAARILQRQLNEASNKDKER